MVTLRLQVDRRTGKVRRPRTDVLPTVPHNQPSIQVPSWHCKYNFKYARNNISNNNCALKLIPPSSQTVYIICYCYADEKVNGLTDCHTIIFPVNRRTVITAQNLQQRNRSCLSQVNRVMCKLFGFLLHCRIKNYLYRGKVSRLTFTFISSFILMSRKILLRN